MEEIYTTEVRERDAVLSRELLASLAPDDARRVAILMEISFRSGLEAGRTRASNALALLA